MQKYTLEQLQAIVAQMRNAVNTMKRMEIHEVVWTDGRRGTQVQPVCSHMAPMVKRLLIAHTEEELAAMEKELLLAQKGGPDVVEN